MQVNGAVCVVTGAANGIGAALAQRFCKEGAAAVIVVDRDAQRIQAVAETISGRAFVVDVRDEKQIAEMVHQVIRDFGGIDLFCSNAGIIAADGEPWWATSSPNDVWQAMWEIHVMAHVYAARACLPHMLERGSGYFLNTVSAAGLLNQAGTAAYATTKHAAIGFAESLAITHGDDGIKVSCLCPQAVNTDMIAGVENGGMAGVDGVLSTEQVADEVIKGLASERFLILPHDMVESYWQRKTQDYDRWLGGMRKLSRMFGRPSLD
jgi:NAD(P)-dependent dehydrogenase (short-subunit alcohol dehydrogenase family)